MSTFAFVLFIVSLAGLCVICFAFYFPFFYKRSNFNVIGTHKIKSDAIHAHELDSPEFEFSNFAVPPMKSIIIHGSPTQATELPSYHMFYIRDYSSRIKHVEFPLTREPRANKLSKKIAQ